MADYKLPITNTPQQFEIVLADKTYLLTCKWNAADEAGWQLDFSDATTNEIIVQGIPLVTGVDLLSGLGYLGFQGSLFVYTDGNDFAVPTFENLGVESFLYFKTSVVDG